jgi:hypothetical protein
MVLAGGLYVAFLFLANRRRHGDGWLDHALAFCLVALLQPFTQKYALAVLLVPALLTSGLMKDRRLRLLMCSATILVLIQPLAPGAGAQRLLQVLGLDFGATLLLTIGIALSALSTPARLSPHNQDGPCNKILIISK